MNIVGKVVLCIAIASSNQVERKKVICKSTLYEPKYVGEYFTTSSVKPQNVLECEDGYVVFSSDLNKIYCNSYSDIYVFTSRVQFVPGYQARLNNQKRSDGSSFTNHSLNSGFVHVKVHRFEYPERSSHGGNVSFKTMWPQSSTFTTSISSSYGSSFNFDKEISVDSSGVLSFKKGSSFTIETNSSTLTTGSDPILSAQNSQDTNECQWSFEVHDKDVVGKNTYWLQTNVMFEMDKNLKNSIRDAVSVDIDFKFTGAHKTLGIWWECFDVEKSIVVRPD